MRELIEEWAAELAGYGVGFYTWVRHITPDTCEGWTNVVGLIVVLLTLFGITIPKVIKEHRRKKDD